MDLRPELNLRLKTNVATVSAMDTNIAIVSLPRDTIRAAVTPIKIKRRDCTVITQSPGWGGQV